MNCVLCELYLNKAIKYKITGEKDLRDQIRIPYVYKGLVWLIRNVKICGLFDVMRKV